MRDPESDPTPVDLLDPCRADGMLAPAPVPRRPDEERRDRRIAEIKAVTIAESLTTAQTARLLSISESAVRRRRADGRLYSFPLFRHWRYASWQFTDSGLLLGIDDVNRTIPRSVHPAFVRGLMLAPRPGLGPGDRLESPRDFLLRGGDPATVIELFEMIRDL